MSHRRYSEAKKRFAASTGTSVVAFVIIGVVVGIAALVILKLTISAEGDNWLAGWTSFPAN